MFTQKTLLAGLAVALVILGIVIYSSPGDDAPAANLDTVTERAKDLMENNQNPVVVNESTTTEVMIATTEPEVASEVSVTTNPKPVTSAPVTPAPTTPVVTTPEPVPTPAPQPTPAPTGITKAEVATHATESSCWSIINDNVYDLTDYVSRHPGGKSRILGICGKDGTRSFEGQHGGQSKPERILAGYFIDTLAS